MFPEIKERNAENCVLLAVMQKAYPDTNLWAPLFNTDLAEEQVVDTPLFNTDPDELAGVPTSSTTLAELTDAPASATSLSDQLTDAPVSDTAMEVDQLVDHHDLGQLETEQPEIEEEPIAAADSTNMALVTTTDSKSQGQPDAVVLEMIQQVEEDFERRSQLLLRTKLDASKQGLQLEQQLELKQQQLGSAQEHIDELERRVNGLKERNSALDKRRIEGMLAVEEHNADLGKRRAELEQQCAALKSYCAEMEEKVDEKQHIIEGQRMRIQQYKAQLQSLDSEKGV
jgi:chromosome segregation ATPase